MPMVSSMGRESLLENDHTPVLLSIQSQILSTIGEVMNFQKILAFTIIAMVAGEFLDNTLRN
jgi:hypothetical protein